MLAGLLLIFPGVISDLVAITLLLLPIPRTVVERSSLRAHGGTIIDGEFRRTR